MGDLDRVIEQTRDIIYSCDCNECKKVCEEEDCKTYYAKVLDFLEELKFIKDK